MFSPTPEIYIIFTALVLRLSTFIVDEVFSLSAASHIYISSRRFENISQNGPEYSHRNLAIARFLVTVVRKNIGGLLSWLVSLSSSVPELTRHGLERGLHVNP